MLKFEWDVIDVPTEFSHRIVAKDEQGNVVKEGKWVGYRCIAQLELYQQEYRAVTEYHADDFPVGVVFKLEVV